MRYLSRVHFTINNTTITSKNCYIILYYSTPLYLQDLKAELLSLKPKALRYNFVNEAPSQVKDILSGNTIKNYTRGHYKRGVE